MNNTAKNKGAVIGVDEARPPEIDSALKKKVLEEAANLKAKGWKHRRITRYISKTYNILID